MRDPPRHVLWAHRAFLLSIVVAALFALVSIWAPFDSQLAERILWSDVVVLSCSMLVLAEHRTVSWRERGEVPGPR